MENFIHGYLECMLWLAKDDNGDTISDITSEDINPDAMSTIRTECTDLYNANREAWEAGGWTDDQAGHDFFLTRNGHGAGFWDRCFNEQSDDIGKTLTDACRPYGEQDLYQGDDGSYYV